METRKRGNAEGAKAQRGMKKRMYQSPLIPLRLCVLRISTFLQTVLSRSMLRCVYLLHVAFVLPHHCRERTVHELQHIGENAARLRGG